MTEQALILHEIRQNLGVITINRPRALNALSGPMLAEIDRLLVEFEADSRVSAVLIHGAGERGLCAGGDIVALYHLMDSDQETAQEYFRIEYSLNYRISQFSKPYIAIMDGIVLGGGMGVSAHGSHRVVTENSRIGMPETGIGFSPDIGGLKLLSEVPDEVGTMMAMTGKQISGADALWAGLADYFVPSEKLEELTKALEAATDAELVDAIIAKFHQSPPESPLSENTSWINTAFAGDSAEEIHDAVAAHASASAHGSELAAELLQALEHNSPTGIKMALYGIRKAKNSTLAQTLNTDLVVTVNSMRGHDLREGIRAQVIDKDRNPQWQPATLAAVEESYAASFFEAPHDLAPLGLPSA